MPERAGPDAPRPWPRWRQVHRWLGLVLGTWFALVGLTGALLVWRNELDAWLNPDLFEPTPGTPTDRPALPLGDLIERLRTDSAIGRIERVRLPAQAGDPVRLQVRAGASRVESGRLEVFVDPATAAVRGLRTLQGWSLGPRHLMRTVYEFHRNLLLGEPGSNAVGLAGALLLTSAGSGVLLAWPRGRRWRQALRVSWRANLTRVALDLHRAGGLLVAVLLLLAAGTGLTLVYPNYVRDLVSLASRVQPVPVLPFRTGVIQDEPLSLDDLATRAGLAFGGQHLTELRLSERGLTGVMFQMRAPGDVHALGDTIAWLHPYTGEILAERSPRQRSAGESLMHWLLPLHVGSALGPAGPWLATAAGLAPAGLLVTGAWVWWWKRRARRTSSAKRMARTAPPRQSSG